MYPRDRLTPQGKEVPVQNEPIGKHQWRMYTAPVSRAFPTSNGLPDTGIPRDYFECNTVCVKILYRTVVDGSRERLAMSSHASETKPLLNSVEFDRWLYAHRVTTAALASSLLTTIAAYPLDSIKSRLQVEKFNGVAHCVRDTYRHEGVGGFFRGMGLPMVSVSTIRTLAFAIYENTKRTMREKRWFEKDTWRDTAIRGAAGGISSGLITSVVSCPLELTKIRLQLDRNIAKLKDPNAPFVPKNTVRSAQEMYRAAGLRGFYLGFPQHMTRDTLGSSFYFATYDSLRWSVRKAYPDQLPYGLPDVSAPFACGLTAGISSWTVTYPADVVKSRVQRNALSGVKSRASRIFIDIFRNSPWDLYRGLGISIMRAGLSHGMVWIIVEEGSRYIERTTVAGISSAHTVNYNARITS